MHSPGKKILGALDVVVSLEELEGEIRVNGERDHCAGRHDVYRRGPIIGLFLVRFVNRPIRALIEGTRHLAQGEYDYQVQIRREDEIGQLARAINEMGRQIGANRTS